MGWTASGTMISTTVRAWPSRAMPRPTIATSAVPPGADLGREVGLPLPGPDCKWQQKRRGTSTFGVPAPRFVTYLENHDQVANSALGLRLRDQTSPGRYRAMTALWLLAPQTPMLFQGQELGTSKPFLYFSDHRDHLADLVREGRREELAGFPEHDPSRAARVPARSQLAGELRELEARRAGELRRSTAFALSAICSS